MEALDFKTFLHKLPGDTETQIRILHEMLQHPEQRWSNGSDTDPRTCPLGAAAFAVEGLKVNTRALLEIQNHNVFVGDSLGIRPFQVQALTAEWDLSSEEKRQELRALMKKRLEELLTKVAEKSQLLATV